MASVTTHSDFETQENKVCHYFHFFPNVAPSDLDSNSGSTTYQTCDMEDTVLLGLSVPIFKMGVVEIPKLQGHSEGTAFISSEDSRVCVTLNSRADAEQALDNCPSCFQLLFHLC